MLVITIQPRSGTCLANPTLSFSRHIGEYIPAIALTPLEKVFNKASPLCFYTFRIATPRKALSFYSRKSNIT
jgi:hypothetical protein